TFPRVIRTGSWSPPKPSSDRMPAMGFGHKLAASGLLVLAFVTPVPGASQGPLIPNTAFEVVAWKDIEGWAADDHAEAFAAFVASCQAVVRRGKGDSRPMAECLTSGGRRGIAA